MSLLLDTHVLIWAALNPSRLSVLADALLRDPRNALFVSSVSGWEIAQKAALGKLELEAPLGAFLTSAQASIGFRELALSHRHAQAVFGLPLHHRDPADRLLIAQTMAESLTLVTNDAAIQRYAIRTAW